MLAWLKKNQKQLVVLLLSAICSVTIHFRPEWRDAILSIGAVLGLVGIHLPPLAYRGIKPPPASSGNGNGNGAPPSEPPPSVKPPPLPMFAMLPLTILFITMGTAGVIIACNNAAKPIVPPNPTAADCIVDRTSAQLACVREAGTEKQADECIAQVKAAKDCTTDGGGK